MKNLFVISLVFLSGCSMLGSKPEPVESAPAAVYFSEFDLKVCAEDLSHDRCEFLKNISAYELIESTQRKSSRPINHITNRAEGI